MKLTIEFDELTKQDVDNLMIIFNAMLQKDESTINPNWSKAPTWAKYWAVDYDGVECWYESEPILNSLTWSNKRGTIWKSSYEKTRSSITDWKTTLRKRPTDE